MGTDASLVALVALVAALSTAPAATAGEGRFTPFGPAGAALGVPAIVVDPLIPTTVYASAGADLYRSADGGTSWQRIAAGGFVRLAAAPSAGGTVLYGATFDRIFRSTDGGRSWGPIFALPVLVDFSDFVHLEVAPSQPSRLYVADENELFRSDDGGDSWTLVYAGVSNVVGLAVEALDADRLLVLDTDRVVASRDGGRSWSAGVRPLSSGFTAYPQHLARSPSSPAVVYVSGVDTFCRSADAGASFDCHYTSFSARGLHVDPAAPLTVYAADPRGGVAVSVDGGDRWRRLQQGLPPALQRLQALDLAADPATGGLYVATADQAVQRISANGTWQPPSLAGFFPGVVTALQFRPGRPSEIYVALQAAFGPDPRPRLVRSRDGGATWEPLGRVGLNSYLVDSFLFDPADPATIYAGSGNLLLRSHDDGATWTGTVNVSVAYYAATGRRTLVAGGCGVQRSADSGATWRETLPCVVKEDPVNGETLRRVYQLVSDPSVPSTVYALTSEGLESDDPRDPRSQTPRLYRSADGGATWHRLPVAAAGLAVAPSRPQTLYALVAGGLATSDDGGRSFRVVGPWPSRISNLAVDARDARTLYATFVDDRDVRTAQRSTDGGVTWQPVDAGLARLGRRAVWNVVADPAVAGRIYAVPVVGGLFVQDVR